MEIASSARSSLPALSSGITSSKRNDLHLQGAWKSRAENVSMQGEYAENYEAMLYRS